MSLPESQPASEVIIREFQSGDEAAFRQLNEEWITHYFTLEAKDRKSFDDPQKTILAPGGRIFFAIADGRHLGCCALLRIGPADAGAEHAAEYEVAKMAVTPHAQGSGVGRKLLQATVDAARLAGAVRLYLETNHTLTPAIHLYESIGFKHLPPERITPSPYQRADVFMEMIMT